MVRRRIRRVGLRYYHVLVVRIRLDRIDRKKVFRMKIFGFIRRLITLRVFTPILGERIVREVV